MHTTRGIRVRHEIVVLRVYVFRGDDRLHCRLGERGLLRRHIDVEGHEVLGHAQHVMISCSYEEKAE